ncbi:MAG TPA: hypothetical protein PK006_11975 [Saprospiraceae bacterium]|nr:hypothetical protein [Saprospiraceae bacterium]
MLIFLLVLHAVYFGLAVNFRSIYLSDSWEFLFQAHNLVHNHTLYANAYTFPLLEEYYSLRTPLYGIFIVLIQLLFSSHLVVLIVQNLLSIWILFSCWSEVQNKQTWHFVLFGLLLLIYPTQQVYSNMIMSDLLFQFCLWMAWIYFRKWTIQQEVKNLILFHVMILLAALTKPVLVYFALALFAVDVVYFGWIKNRWKWVGIVSFVPLVLLIWCLRNQYHTGDFHYSYMQTNNLYNYNAEYLLEYHYGSAKADSITDSWRTECEKYNEFSKRCDCLEEKAVHCISSDLMKYSLLQVRGMIRFFIDPGRYDLINFLPALNTKTSLSFFGELDQKSWKGILNYLSEMRSGLLWFMILAGLVNMVVVFFLIYHFVRKTIWFDLQTLFLYAIIFYIAVITGPLGNARFKMAVFPFILLLVVMCLNRVKKSESITQLFP